MRHPNPSPKAFWRRIHLARAGAVHDPLAAVQHRKLMIDTKAKARLVRKGYMAKPKRMLIRLGRVAPGLDQLRMWSRARASGNGAGRSVLSHVTELTHQFARILLVRLTMKVAAPAPIQPIG